MLKLAVGSALLWVATQSLAATLGPAQGDVIIGRPFDVLVQSRLDPNQSIADLCLQVQLQYGESGVAAGTVSTALHSVGPDGVALLRVRSTEPINEPIVTLALQVGCQTVFRRSYTLLADWGPAQALAGAAAPLPMVSPAAAAVPVPAAAPNGAPVAGVAAATALAAQPPAQTPIRLSTPAARPANLERLRSKAPPRVVPVPAATAPAATPRPPAPPAPAPVAGGARLQLDPIALPGQAPPVAAAVAPESVDAAATAAPEGPLAEVGTAPGAPTATEQELLQLRAEQERLRLELQSTQAQLLQMQAQAQAGVPAIWLFGAGALLLLLLGGGWFAYRSGRWLPSRPAAVAPTPWWVSTMPGDAAAQSQGAIVPAQTVPAPALDARRADAAPAAPAVPAAALVVSSDPATAAPAPTAAAVPPSWLDVDGVMGLEVAEGRASTFGEVDISALDLAALIETWQQAEFFESIAQRTQAMEVLKRYVTEHARASEAPYLRWLALAAQDDNPAWLGEATQFYEHHFQRIAPRTESIEAGLNLEHDARLLQTLQAQWPQPTAAVVIERALASQPGDPDSELTVRTLAAFDDLLTLSGVLEVLQNSPLPMLDLSFGPAPAPTASSETVAGLPTLPGAIALQSWPSADSVPVAAANPPKPDPLSIDFDLGSLDWEPGSRPPSGKP
ncbi:hypothetical protein [Serpentinimonas barnesii]|uniref:hypothetical protein n=1 Tax=Serpentinimonas barnesii TaxID=1458427 RepID=UPI000495A12C|nr:hypothetical protein [Serpentinimonas barnesii]